MPSERSDTYGNSVSENVPPSEREATADDVKFKREDVLQRVREVAAGSDVIHTGQYLAADVARVRDGCEAVCQLIAIHLIQARREGRARRQARRIYGQDVSGVLRQTNQVNLTLCAAWLSVSLGLLDRRPQRNRPSCGD